MTKKEIIDYWLKTSDKDFKAMESLYNAKHYSWTLFVGHLVIEKLLKAYYVKTIDINTPFIHDLVKIANKTDLPLDEEQKDILDLITTFNIKTR